MKKRNKNKTFLRVVAIVVSALIGLALPIAIIFS